jgi:hypothetical protein
MNVIHTGSGGVARHFDNGKFFSRLRRKLAGLFP